MNSTEHTVLTVDRYFAALKQRDFDALHALLAPDVSVHYHGTTGQLPWTGQWTGIEGFDEFVSTVADYVDIVELEILQRIASESRLVVQSRGIWRIRHTGREVHAQMINVFTVRDSRIVGYEVYNDTAAFVDAMQG